MRRVRVDEGKLSEGNWKMATMISSTEVHGARLLREIAAEEGSLEDVSLYSNSSLTPSFPSSFSVLGHMKVTCISSMYFLTGIAF